MAVLSILLSVLLVAASVLIVLIVIVQRPKQEGLGAAFGGGTLDSALGAHTTDVLQKITVYLGVVFFVSAIGLAMVKTRQFRASAASDVMEKVETSDSEGPAIPPELQNLIDGEGSDPASGVPADGADPAAPGGNDATSLLPETKGLDAPAEGKEDAPVQENAPGVDEAAPEKAGADEKAEAEPAPNTGGKEQSGAGSKDKAAPKAQGEPKASE